jgi:hydroxymethylpyrimidine pyrophosphatase-like HAD family hydrolase
MPCGALAEITACSMLGEARCRAPMGNLVAYRFLLFDLDGTLLDEERKIRARTHEVLRGLMERGIGVGFATGRPPRSAHRYVEDLRPTGPLVFFNGCFVWDVAQACCLQSACLELDVAVEALRVAAREGAHANVYLEDEIYVDTVSATAAASAKKDGVEQIAVGDLSAWLLARGAAPTKILFIHPAAAIAALEHELRAAIGDGPVLVNSEPDYSVSHVG